MADRARLEREASVVGSYVQLLDMDAASVSYAHMAPSDRAALKVQKRAYLTVLDCIRKRLEALDRGVGA